MTFPLRLRALPMLGLSMSVLGCRTVPQNQAAPASIPVTVVTLQKSDVSVTDDWVGTLDGYVNAQIQPQVSGYLIKQLYKEGTSVTKGQILFEIDPRPLRAQVEQAEGQLEQVRGQLAQAQAALGLAKVNFNRDEPLAEQHAIAQSQADSDRAQLAQAEANVTSVQASIVSATASLSTAKLNLGFTEVRSLIAGVAGQATTQVGSLVSPQSVLTSVSQLDPIRIYFSISDREYLVLAKRQGAPLLTSTARVPLTLLLTDGDIYPHKGYITFVDRQINQQTGAIRVAATFPNPENLLRPGQYGKVRAETRLVRNAILLPQRAVQDLQGTDQVYVVDADNKAHLVNVSLGQQSGNDWIVNAGLQPGMRVVVDNLQKLAEGTPVQPRQAAEATLPGLAGSGTRGEQ